MMENNLLSLIIFAPLAGAAINWFVGRRLRNERFIGIVACASVGVSTSSLSISPSNQTARCVRREPVLGSPLDLDSGREFRADFGLAMDRLSGIYALFVTFVGFLIHVFAPATCMATAASIVSSLT